MKKFIIYLSSALFVGCATFPSSGPPFVKTDSGELFGTLKEVKNPAIEAWVFTVDKRTVARNFLGESVSHTGDVYVSPGSHVVGVSCFYEAANKYNRINITLNVEAGRIYNFSCGTDGRNRATYKVTDSLGLEVPILLSEAYEAPNW
jgi:hypothetical protein